MKETFAFAVIVSILLGSLIAGSYQIQSRINQAKEECRLEILNQYNYLLRKMCNPAYPTICHIEPDDKQFLQQWYIKETNQCL